MEVEKFKVIFTCLGPELKFTDSDGKEYSDGDTAELEIPDYNSVISKNLAQNWTSDLEIRTKRLVQTAKETRAKILEKASKRRKGVT